MTTTAPTSTYAQRTIKNMATALRPRERLQKYGAEYIDLHELIAIIIRSGTPGHNALDIAREVELIIRNKGIRQDLAIEDFAHIPGVSKIKATEIIAAITLGRRVEQLRRDDHTAIKEPADCFRYLQDIAGMRKEHFVALYLDTKNCFIAKEIISIGTLDSSLVHPREVFEPAYRHHSARIVLAHNHPSGDCTPSEEDIHITTLLVDVGALLGVAVLDHLIVSKNGFFALGDQYASLFEPQERH